MSVGQEIGNALDGLRLNIETLKKMSKNSLQMVKAAKKFDAEARSLSLDMMNSKVWKWNHHKDFLEDEKKDVMAAMQKVGPTVEIAKANPRVHTKNMAKLSIETTHHIILSNWLPALLRAGIYIDSKKNKKEKSLVIKKSKSKSSNLNNKDNESNSNNRNLISKAASTSSIGNSNNSGKGTLQKELARIEWLNREVDLAKKTIQELNELEELLDQLVIPESKYKKASSKSLATPHEIEDNNTEHDNSIDQETSPLLSPKKMSTNSPQTKQNRSREEEQDDMCCSCLGF